MRFDEQPAAVKENVNVFSDLPEDGTVIGTATQEELQTAQDLECRHLAHMRLLDSNIQIQGASYKDLLQEFMDFETKSAEFWKAIHQKLGVPWEWILRIDLAHGYIYVINPFVDEVE
ncbi:hypothetical protein GKZ89_19950 [Bacillus mangrovi]|uniref:Uncharacterized protein n=1 Tax=Metabacillus mangrovi TaxID=1491830 RepID=A0A7X2S999_9BACI|nr:hypothetical protein [Metabacillus mangrovi]MTH55672.1 hypothetical protein [Metabacillus mangrovi]